MDLGRLPRNGLLPCISDGIEQYDNGESKARLEKAVTTLLELEGVPPMDEVLYRIVQ